MEMSGQRHALAALPPGNEPPVPIDRRLGGPQSRVRYVESQKKKKKEKHVEFCSY